MDREYQFVGAINLFGLYPDFLFPVYEREDEYFFHNGDKNRIYDFDPITESVRDKIVFLQSEQVKITDNTKKKYYHEQDPLVYAFQESPDEIFCSDLTGMVKFLISFTTDDGILQKQIRDFINENLLEYLKVDSCNKLVLPKIQTCETVFMPLMLSGIEASVYAGSYDTGWILYYIVGNSIAKKRANFLVQLGIKWNEIETKKNGFSWVSDMKLDYYRLGMESFKSGEFHLADSSMNFSDIRKYKELFHKSFHKNNYIAGIGSVYKGSTDFDRLKQTFDSIIKRIPYTFEMYDVCIKCQNAIINENENELITIINENQQLFYMLNKSLELDDYLNEYVQSHIFKKTGIVDSDIWENPFFNLKK